MLNLTEANKALCFQDSVEKPFYVFLYFWVPDYYGVAGGQWQYWKTIQDEEIVSESVEITDGCLENGEFSFGSYVIPEIKLKRKYNTMDYTNLLAIPIQKIGSQYIAYFYGIVNADEKSDDKTYSTMTIRSVLGGKMDMDVASILPVYNNSSAAEYIAGVLSAGNKMFITSEDLTANFRNAIVTVNLNNVELPNTLTVSDFIKISGEFLGATLRSKDKRIITAVETVNGILKPTGSEYSFLPPIPQVEFFRIGTKKVALGDTVDDTRVLPSGYKRAEYLGCKGASYFDTGIGFSRDIGLKYSFCAEQIRGNAPHILSTQNFYAPQQKYNYDQSEVGFFWNYCGEEPQPSDRPTNQNGVINISAFLAKSKVYTDGVISINNRTLSAPIGTATTGGNFFLGTYGGDPTLNSYWFAGKIFDFKIFDKEAQEEYKSVISDMLPALKSDGTVGMYDLKRNNFYVSTGGNAFYAPPTLDKYEAEHFITLNSNENQSCLYNTFQLTTQAGAQTNYITQMSGAGKTDNSFKIENNFLYDALSLNNPNDIKNCTDDLVAYLESLDIRKETLSLPYAPFLESGDFIIANTSTQNLPTNYTELNSIYFNGLTGIKTNSFLKANNFKVDLKFKIDIGENQNTDPIVIFGTGLNNTTLLRNILFYFNPIEYALIFQTTYSTEGQYSRIFMPNYSLGQAIELHFEYDGSTLKYSGDLGRGEVSFSSVPNQGFNEEELKIHLGGNINENFLNTKIHFYDFKFSCNYKDTDNTDKISQCDLIPCFDKSTHIFGMYDIISNTMLSATGDTNLNEYEPKKAAVPLLAVHSQGIHSMIADISSNINK